MEASQKQFENAQDNAIKTLLKVQAENAIV